RDLLLAAAFPEALNGVAWGEALPIDPDEYDDAPPEPPGSPALEWGSVAPEALRKDSYESWKRDFSAWIVGEQRLTVLECPLAGMLSAPDEGEGAFRARLATPLREARDAALEKLRT